MTFRTGREKGVESERSMMLSGLESGGPNGSDCIPTQLLSTIVEDPAESDADSQHSQPRCWFAVSRSRKSSNFDQSPSQHALSAFPHTNANTIAHDSAFASANKASLCSETAREARSLDSSEQTVFPLARQDVLPCPSTTTTTTTRPSTTSACSATPCSSPTRSSDRCVPNGEASSKSNETNSASDCLVLSENSWHSVSVSGQLDIQPSEQ